MTAGAPVRLPKGHMSQEEFDALGYPSIPSHWTKEWMLEQIELEKVDPRVNPNLLLEETSQEFWDNMSRKPYAKAILKSERHWSKRRNAWLRQFEQVEMANALRSELAEELENCPPELKRMVQPMLKYKIAEIALGTSLRAARQQRVPLSTILQREEQVQDLRSLRQRLDAGGAKEAERLLQEFTARAKDRLKLTQEEASSRSETMVVDTDTMAKLMTRAQKLRKDGYVSWEQGSVEEAFESWCESEACLFRKRLRPEDVAGNKMIDDLHSILLKNVSQAAIKLGHWSDALQAADDALAIDEEDHKAWFRRACALEGLGRYGEATAALTRIDGIAVGRADRGRIEKDVMARRKQIALLESKHEGTEKLALQRALQQGVFGREAEGVEDQDLEALEEELKQLEEEEAQLDAEVPSAVSTPFAEGDRVVTLENLGDISAGQQGSVVEVDKDGDIKVLFDGQTEAQLIFHVDFDTLALAGAMPTPSAPSVEKKYLTHEGACDLLEALASAYDDPGFQRQVSKLCRDVRWNVKEFTAHLPKVALEVQRWVLPRWGFDPTTLGAREAEVALAAAKERSTGARQEQLQRLADEVTRSLFGEMYPVVFQKGAVSAPTC